jgi:hypothetical protein
MKLKNVFRRIHPDAANLFHGRSPLSEINNDLILAQSMPSGAVHTNNSDTGGEFEALIKQRLAMLRSVTAASWP